MTDAGSRNSILIVEDERNTGMALAYLMEREGYRSRWVPDGDAALAAVAENPPDLVLLDAMLPGRSGYEVCQRLRGEASLRHLRIVMMTAKGGASEAEKIRALGADCLIRKPFSTQELTGSVRALLSGLPPTDA